MTPDGSEVSFAFVPGKTDFAISLVDESGDFIFHLHFWMNKYIIQNDCDSPCNDHWDESKEIRYTEAIRYLNPMEMNTVRIVYTASDLCEVHINEYSFTVPIRLYPGNRFTKYIADGDAMWDHMCISLENLY
ncbi:unnamed protein product [Bursaphelenchus okinawaensis]|uniref:Galectin n=1 Tax=Bursaphelenchus okinawaensis TaxID=465554 RepID=A0A811JS42_9BILA|nr:unnamed protein product [Bursaphelenchus okinawaensis]CAG9080447.1 unnamed protein product [Bursaphelenchus okinawaensis]